MAGNCSLKIGLRVAWGLLVSGAAVLLAGIALSMYARADEMRRFADYAIHGRPASLEAIIEMKPWLARGGALLMLLGALVYLGSLLWLRDRRETGA